LIGKNEIFVDLLFEKGSLERFIGILIEHLEGKWPLWLSPRQLMVIPVAKKFNIYAEEVQKTLVSSGFFADVDLSGKVCCVFCFCCVDV
jgi:threonyl-tRNA synthetase